jgi:hypothetical protein
LQIGHDYPQQAHNNVMVPGMQMKILAAAPGSPLMRCMLDHIIGNVRRRWTPSAKDNPLSLTGPALLYRCYQQCSSLKQCTAEGAEQRKRRFQGPRENWYRHEEIDGAIESAIVSATPAINTTVAITCVRHKCSKASPFLTLFGVLRLALPVNLGRSIWSCQQLCSAVLFKTL